MGVKFGGAGQQDVKNGGFAVKFGLAVWREYGRITTAAGRSGPQKGPVF
jgi:hypothetical protein